MQDGSVREKPLGLPREARPWRWGRVPGPLRASREGLRAGALGKGCSIPRAGAEALSIGTARSGTPVGHVGP